MYVQFKEMAQEVNCNDLEVLSDLLYKKITTEMDRDFKVYRELIAIGQRIKQLKLDKPPDYKKTVRIKHIMNQ